MTSLPKCLALAVVAGCAQGQRSAADATPTAASRMIITAEDIQRSPGVSIEQLLVTRIPGVTLARAQDGHVIIRLRGTTTIMGDQEALIVVNGIALDPNSAGNLFAINPSDVETIEVVRDAAGTAMYGARGANGVIIVRTKRS